jgi:hypothetical protein
VQNARVKLYRANNPEKCRERVRRWQHANPDSVKAHNDRKNEARRQKKAAARLERICIEAKEQIYASPNLLLGAAL